MKKMIAALLALTLLLCLSACGAMGPKTEIIYVQTQSVRTIGENEIRTEYTYSVKGKPLSVKTYFNDTLYQTVNTRTSNGISYLTTIDDEGNESNQSMTTVYDDNGNVSVLEISVAGTPVSRTTYTYDEAGRVLTSENVTSDGTLKYTYTYDANGNVTVMEMSDSSTETVTRTEYTYDERDYVILEKTYNEENVLQGSITYTYEANDAGRTQTYYDGEGNPTGEVLQLEYDEHGNLIREVTIMDGEVLQTIVNTYEAMEVPVEE